MGRFLESVAQASPPLLWIDDDAYAARLLAGGNPPWLEAGGFVAFRRKAIGLLRSDVAAVPVAGIAGAWAAAHPGLRAEMEAARKLPGALRLLLADEGLQAHLAAIIQGLGAACSAQPLALVLPAPAAWLAACLPARAAEVDEDAIDAAAMYMAEFLRAFAPLRVDAVLLDERAAATPPDLLEPLANLAAHYRWDLGRRLSVPGEAVGGGFVIAPGGLELSAAFWAGEPPPPVPAGGFRFVEVPADGVPEAVLDRLRLVWR